MNFYLSTKDYNRKYSNIEFRYLICKKCGTISLDNIPNNYKFIYKDSYYSTKTKIQIIKDNKNRIAYLNKLNLKKKSSIIEIGSGYGEFLYSTKLKGYKPIGYDINPKLNEFTMSNYGIKTITNKKISSIKKKFDLIVSFHSLEHFENPKNAINLICKLAKKNTHVIFSLPNTRSIGFRILKDKWPHLDAPRHIHLIDFNLIIKMLKKKKFELVSLDTNDPDSRYNNRLSYAMYFANILSKKSFFELNKYLRFFYNLMGLITIILLFPIESRNYNSSCYTVIFQKK